MLLYRQLPSRAELDLLDPVAVQQWFSDHQPMWLFLLPRVGILPTTATADFLLDNLKIQTNVIETAWRSGVRRLLFLSSGVSKFAEQPIKESRC